MSRLRLVIAAWFFRGHKWLIQRSSTWVWDCTTQAILRSGAQDHLQQLNSLFTNAYVPASHAGPSTRRHCALAFVGFTEKKYALTLIRFFTSLHYRFAPVIRSRRSSLELFLAVRPYSRPSERSTKSFGGTTKIAIQYGTVLLLWPDSR